MQKKSSGTGGRTDGPTDIVTYRVACTRLKTFDSSNKCLCMFMGGGAHIFFPDSNLISLLDGEDDCDPLPNFPLWLRKRLGFDCKIIDGKDCQSDFPTAITAKVLISATSYFKRRDIFL